MEQEQNIHWDKNDPTKLDLEYYETIGKLAKMILWGGIYSIAWSVINVFALDDKTPLNVITTLMEGALYFSLSIMAYRALVKGKRNAIFLSRSLLIICLSSWLLSFILTVVFDSNSISNFINIWGIIILVWCVAGLVWTFVDSEIKEVFPESYRRHSVKELIFVICVPLIPILLYVYIIISTVAGVKKEFISNIVKSTNNECPMETEWGSVLTKADYKNGCMTYYFHVDEGSINISKLQKYKDLIRRNQIKTIQDLPNTHPLSNKVLTELGVDLKFVVEGESGSFDIDITKEDIKNSTKEKPTPYGLLKTKIELLNMFLPQDIDEGIQLVEASLNGRTLSMKYVMDEDFFDMNDIEAQKNVLHDNHHDEFWNNIDNGLNDLCYRSLDKIKYVYTGITSKKKVEVVLSMKSK